MTCGNRMKLRIRAKVEHVFTEQKEYMGAFIRTIGDKRADAIATLASTTCNMKCWHWIKEKEYLF